MQQEMDTIVLTKDVNLKKPSKGFPAQSATKKILCFAGIFVLAIIVVASVCLGLLLPHETHDRHDKDIGWCGVKDQDLEDTCQNPSCNITMIESIPENLTYPAGAPSHPSIYSGWLKLLDTAQSTIYIASSYWSLRSDDVTVKDPSSWQGDDIFNKLIEVGKRGVKIRIVHQVDTKSQPNNDPKILEKMGLAEVRVLNLERLIGAGILHSKMWLVDNVHFYLGSANMDWRSLTQVKELGLLTSDCSCLANDMSKIFDIYWMLATPSSQIPDHWPDNLDTHYNKDSPMPLKINGNKLAQIYLSSSPPQLCTHGRTTDIDSILDVINKAKSFIHISVMDYSPTFLYTWPEKYWAVIDDALRTAAFNRGVQVYFMASDWSHTKPAMIPFLKSLAILNDVSHVDVEVRLFKVPAGEVEIPYSRVQHTKYMVTENAAYIGTSNWSADYFVSTGGIGCVINQTSSDAKNQLNWDTIQGQLQDVFSRDWNSNYTKSIWEY